FVARQKHRQMRRRLPRAQWGWREDLTFGNPKESAHGCRMAGQLLPDEEVAILLQLIGGGIARRIDTHVVRIARAHNVGILGVERRAEDRARYHERRHRDGSWWNQRQMSEGG